jgi:hypothetical protein
MFRTQLGVHAYCIYLSIYLSIYQILSIYLSIYRSIDLSIYLSSASVLDLAKPMLSGLPRTFSLFLIARVRDTVRWYLHTKLSRTGGGDGEVLHTVQCCGVQRWRALDLVLLLVVFLCVLGIVSSRELVCQCEHEYSCTHIHSCCVHIECVCIKS